MLLLQKSSALAFANTPMAMIEGPKLRVCNCVDSFQGSRATMRISAWGRCKYNASVRESRFAPERACLVRVCSSGCGETSNTETFWVAQTWQGVFRRGESDGTHGTRSGGDQGGGMGEREGPQHERVLAARPNGSLSGSAIAIVSCASVGDTRWTIEPVFAATCFRVLSTVVLSRSS